MRKKEAFSYYLSAVRLDEFAVMKNDKITSSEVQLVNSFVFDLESETHEILVSYRVEYTFQGRAFVVLMATCAFKVKPVDFAAMARPNKKRQIIIPQVVAAQLAAITASTARGVLFAKLEGTEFSRYILPLVNVKDWISKDIVFPSPQTDEAS